MRDASVAVANSYRHTQIGWMPVLGVGVVFGSFWIGPTHALAGAAILAYSTIMVGAALTRGALTVSVDPAAVKWSRGIGVLRCRVPLIAVHHVDVVPVRVRPRTLPQGYWYGASIQHAVRLSLSGGGYELIRSSEPMRLVAAIEREMDRARAAGTRRSQPPGPWATRTYHSSGARLLLVLVMALVPAFVHEALSPLFQLPPQRFYVGTRWHRTRIQGDRIQSVERLESMPQVIRSLERYSLGWNPAGRFLVEGLGETEIFLATQRPPYLLVRGVDRPVILNLRQAERTNRLLQVLTGWINERAARRKGAALESPDARE
jgi:hypothetical protein